MSSKSKVAVITLKTHIGTFNKSVLLQRYFNKIALGITISFDSIIKRLANKGSSARFLQNRVSPPHAPGNSRSYAQFFKPSHVCKHYKSHFPGIWQYPDQKLSGIKNAVSKPG